MYQQSERNLLNINIFSTRPRNMLNFSLLAAEIGWWVWGTPSNFNGFRVLASLLHRRHSTDVNQTLHDVWPSPELVYYVYIFGGSYRNRILHCQIAKCVWFCRNQKIFPRDDPFLLKPWLKLTYPLLIAASLDTFCLVAPQR